MNRNNHRIGNRGQASWALTAVLCVTFSQPAQATCDCSSLPSLADALDYAVLGLSGAAVTIRDTVYQDNGAIGANVGVTGLLGSLQIENAASVSGNVDHAVGSLVTCTPLPSCVTKVGGVILPQDMSAPDAAAVAAAAAFAALTPTQSFGAIDTSTTISGNGCINIVDVASGIDLAGEEQVRLSGRVSDYFVLNISGNVSTADTADIILDGVDPSHVILNMVTPGAVVDLNGGSGGHFTVLNPTGDILSHGKGTTRGAFIAGGSQLLIDGAFDLFPDPFLCNTDSCPDPDQTGSTIQQPATPPGRSTGNTSFFRSYFDTDDHEGHLEHFKLDAAGVVKDDMDNDAIDPVLNVFVGDPFWDGATPLLSDTSRTLYTTRSNARDALANVTESELSLSSGELPAYPNPPASTADLRTALLAYLNGQDAFDIDNDSNTSELRSAVLGSIFRSNPQFIGTPTTLLRHESGFESFYQAYRQRDRTVYVNANDGMLHAFAAGAYYDPSNPAAFDAGSGEELFGYVPGLLLPWIKLMPRSEDSDGNQLAQRFVDGALSAADAKLGSSPGWTTVLISAFRDYAEGYMALDVTDPGATSGDTHFPYPNLLWEFSDARLGEAWSRPVITRVKLAAATGTGDNCGVDDGDGDCQEQWVAIIGGGYSFAGDPNHEDFVGDPTSVGWRDESKALFMISLDTGDILASVSFDATGSDGPAEMKYSLPSQPAVFDIDNDRFADIVIIGDLGGQVWKWDVSNLGVDSDADPQMDNWSVGVFFSTPGVALTAGGTHYKSFFYPAAAAYVNGQLTYAFATGERADLVYGGDALVDDNNRAYVMRDPNPTGASSIPATAYDESNLTDVTLLGVDTNDGPDDLGFFTKAAEGEKFVSDLLIFSGQALFASYEPSVFPTCGPGLGFIQGVSLSNAAGFFDTNATPEAADRKLLVGSGVPSTPRISAAPNPSGDVGLISTSEGELLTFDPPDRDAPESTLLYWRQQF